MPNKRSKIGYTFSISDRQDLQILYHYLYDNVKLFLGRKKTVCDKYFEKNGFIKKQNKYRRIEKTKSGRYVATCNYNDKKYVGTFDTDMDAAAAADKALIKAIGLERAKYKTNFPIENYL